MKNLYDEWAKHSLDTMGREELNKAYIEVMQAAGQNASTNHPRRKAGRNLPFRASIAACCAAVAILLAGGILYLALKRDAVKEQVQLCELTTANGQIRKLCLPDGTQVTLNSGSTLIYPERYGKGERRAYLSGEAIFEVTKNGTPFIVNTADLEICVHGTVFNVNAYPDSRSASATLCSGSISARIKATGKEIDMIPSQNLTYNKEKSSYELSEVDTSEDTAWESGKLCFSSKTVHEIAKILERTYGVNVYVTSGKYDKALLTAKFIYGESLNDVMRAICRLVPDMKYSIDGSNIYIK